jgi:hypothetical protein
MEIPAQTLPRVEPGHAVPEKMVLPRVEGVGVKDAPGDPDYPKMVPHPIHGSVMALSADHEQEILTQIADLPPAAPPTDDQVRDAEIEKALKRPMTDSEKAFVSELEMASRTPGQVIVDALDDDATDSVETAQTTPPVSQVEAVPMVMVPVPHPHPSGAANGEGLVANATPEELKAAEGEVKPDAQAEVAAVPEVDQQAEQASQQGAEQ